MMQICLFWRIILDWAKCSGQTISQPFIVAPIVVGHMSHFGKEAGRIYACDIFGAGAGMYIGQKRAATPTQTAIAKSDRLKS